MHTRTPVEPPPDLSARVAFMDAIRVCWTPDPLQALMACAPAFDAWVASTSKIVVGAGAWRHLEADTSPRAESVRAGLRNWWAAYPAPEVEWVFDAALLALWTCPAESAPRWHFIGSNKSPSFKPQCIEPLPNGGFARPIYTPGERNDFRRRVLRLFRRELDQYMDALDAKHGQAHSETARDASSLARHYMGETLGQIAGSIYSARAKVRDPEDAVRKAIRSFARRAGLPIPTRRAQRSDTAPLDGLV